MNAGLRGAHDLAWKLAAVIRGEAHERLLVTYSDEQRALDAVGARDAQGFFNHCGYPSRVSHLENRCREREPPALIGREKLREGSRSCVWCCSGAFAARR